MRSPRRRSLRRGSQQFSCWRALGFLLFSFCWRLQPQLCAAAGTGLQGATNQFWQLQDEAPRTAYGPSGRAPAHVFAFSDKENPALCHLARSTEAAGGWLRVMGLQRGRDDLDFGDDPDLAPEADEFKDRSYMLKKHWFLLEALRRLPANATVVFLDAFDTLFQRPLDAVVEAYYRLAGPLAVDGRLPLIYGGERNCWPFGHDGQVPVWDVSLKTEQQPRWVHSIPEGSIKPAGSTESYRLGPADVVEDRHVCSRWLSQQQDLDERRGAAKAGRAAAFPFVNSGAFVGQAATMRTLLRRLVKLHRRTGEYEDQALTTLTLLQNPSLGFVDSTASIFLSLHGHEPEDLERPLCRGHYFQEKTAAGDAKAHTWVAPGPLQAAMAPVEGYRAARSLQGLTPPALRLSQDQAPAFRGPPSVLHFNGAGKLHLSRCFREFIAEGVAGPARNGSRLRRQQRLHAKQAAGEPLDHAALLYLQVPAPWECTILDEDRRKWQLYRYRTR